MGAKTRLKAAKAKLIELRECEEIICPGNVHFKGAWQAETKSLLRAIVTTNLLVDKMEGMLWDHGEEGFKEKGWVKVPEAKDRAHAWWVVPDVGVD